MIERLLTVNELKKLFQLGYFKHYDNEENTAWLTYKAIDKFKNKIHNCGYFHIDDLDNHKNDKFIYPFNPEESYILKDGFRIVNYKFYYFWENILGKKNNFEEINL